VPLKFAEPYGAYEQMHKFPKDVARQIELEKIKDLNPRKRRPLRFLTYTPTDGFANQVASLMTAIKLAWLTKRVLVLPPILGHYEGPARGNCHNPAISGLTNQTIIKAGKQQNRKDLPLDHY